MFTYSEVFHFFSSFDRSSIMTGLRQTGLKLNTFIIFFKAINFARELKHHLIQTGPGT